MSYKLAAIAHQLALSLVIAGSLDRKQQHVVKVKDYLIDSPKLTRVIPTDYAGDSWRRQGKRRGSPRK